MRPVKEVLLEGIRAGQFGGKSEPHGDHAMGFLNFCSDPSREFVGSVVDIGSGAGLPALVLADAYPMTSWSLVERRRGRTELLSRAIHRLELSDRVAVVAEDAAMAGRGPLRGSADWVTARSFGPPADTAECAAPFLVVGGSLLVSEPFGTSVAERWPESGLSVAGLEFAEVWETESGRYARLVRNDTEIPKLPRPGARKKPLF